MTISFIVRRIRPQVYFVSFDSDVDAALTFLRYQEFQESEWEDIRLKPFTIAGYVAKYTKEKSKDERKFTYASDYYGYNIPLSLIGQVQAAGIPDENEYDDAMRRIQAYVAGDAVCQWTHNLENYIICVLSENDNGKQRRSTIMHELAHALYAIDPTYTRGVDTMLGSLADGDRQQLFSPLMAKGYSSDTAIMHDELQAYIATGESGFFDNVKDQEGLDGIRQAIRKLFYARMRSFISDDEMSKVDWICGER